MPKPIYLMVAIAQNGAIGKDRKLPWNIPAEWNYFINTTADGVMVMGRICAEEFGKALPGRDMIAITRNKEFELPGFKTAHSISDAITQAEASPYEGPIWVCGGVDIYKAAFPIAERLYITMIHQSFEADTFFPEDWKACFPKKLECRPLQDAGIRFDICIFEK